MAISSTSRRQLKAWLTALATGLGVGGIALSVSAEPTRSFPLPEPAIPVGEQPRAPDGPPVNAPAAPQYSAYQSAPAAAPTIPSWPPTYAYPPGNYPGSAYPGAGAPSFGTARPPGDQAGSSGSATDTPKARNVSLSLSLLHLIGPLAEGTLELRLADHVGLGAVVGRGNFPLEGDDYTVWEYGGQLNVYSSAFEGLMVSAEALHFSGEGEPEPGVRGTGSGQLLSALIGYKGISSGGFTVVLQGGISRVLAEATAEKSGLGSRTEDTALWLPTANVNLGLSL